MTSEAHSFPTKRVNYPEIIFFQSSTIFPLTWDTATILRILCALIHVSRFSILFWPQVWTTLPTKTLSWHGNVWTAALGGWVCGSEETRDQLGPIVSLRSPWAMYIGGSAPKCLLWKTHFTNYLYTKAYIKNIFASSFQTSILLIFSWYRW